MKLSNYESISKNFFDIIPWWLELYSFLQDKGMEDTVRVLEYNYNGIIIGLDNETELNVYDIEDLYANYQVTAIKSIDPTTFPTNPLDPKSRKSTGLNFQWQWLTISAKKWKFPLHMWKTSHNFNANSNLVTADNFENMLWFLNNKKQTPGFQGEDLVYVHWRFEVKNTLDQIEDEAATYGIDILETYSKYSNIWTPNAIKKLSTFGYSSNDIDYNKSLEKPNEIFNLLINQTTDPIKSSKIKNIQAVLNDKSAMNWLVWIKYIDGNSKSQWDFELELAFWNSNNNNALTYRELMFLRETGVSSIITQRNPNNYISNKKNRPINSLANILFPKQITNSKTYKTETVKTTWNFKYENNSSNTQNDFETYAQSVNEWWIEWYDASDIYFDLASARFKVGNIWILQDIPEDVWNSNEITKLLKDFIDNLKGNYDWFNFSIDGKSVFDQLIRWEGFGMDNNTEWLQKFLEFLEWVLENFDVMKKLRDSILDLDKTITILDYILWNGGVNECEKGYEDLNWEKPDDVTIEEFKNVLEILKWFWNETIWIIVDLFKEWQEGIFDFNGLFNSNLNTGPLLAKIKLFLTNIDREPQRENMQTRFEDLYITLNESSNGQLICDQDIEWNKFGLLRSNNIIKCKIGKDELFLMPIDPNNPWAGFWVKETIFTTQDQKNISKEKVELLADQYKIYKVNFTDKTHNTWDFGIAKINDILRLSQKYQIINNAEASFKNEDLSFQRWASETISEHTYDKKWIDISLLNSDDFFKATNFNLNATREMGIKLDTPKSNIQKILPFLNGKKTILHINGSSDQANIWFNLNKKNIENITELWTSSENIKENVVYNVTNQSLTAINDILWTITTDTETQNKITETLNNLQNTDTNWITLDEVEKALSNKKIDQNIISNIMSKLGYVIQYTKSKTINGKEYTMQLTFDIDGKLINNESYYQKGSMWKYNISIQ